MRVLLLALLASALIGCATMRAGEMSILIDLDPASTERTVIVESITADRSGVLYLPDRVTGNILRVDPKSPKAVVVGKIEAREIEGKRVNADPSGIAFNSQGDLFVAVGPFREVVRIRSADLNPAKPGLAQTFATGTAGANGIVFDRQGNLFVSAAQAASSIVSARMAAQPKQRCKSTSTYAHFPTARPSSRLSPTVLSSMPMVRSWSQTRRAAPFGRS